MRIFDQWSRGIDGSSPLDGFPLRVHNSGMDMLGKNMEERDWVFHAFVARGDVQPVAEELPLAPGGGVFLEYCLR